MQPESIFPFLAEAPADFRRSFTASLIPKRIAKGESLAMQADLCSYLPFVAQGSVRVFRVGESGREINLYRIEEGESCVITAFCILNEEAFPAFATAELDTDLFLLPASSFHGWMNRHEFFRSYVFSLFSRRFASILTSIEEIAFGRMDERLATLLLRFDEDEIQRTHQELAHELSTAREVVSRLLKDFERDGLLTLSRGRIRIVDRAGLKKRCDFLPDR